MSVYASSALPEHHRDPLADFLLVVTLFYPCIGGTEGISTDRNKGREMRMRRYHRVALFSYSIIVSVEEILVASQRSTRFLTRVGYFISD